jgi:hypothetical protein
MESKKHELSIMKVVLFSLMMIGVGLLSGCTSSPPAVDNSPLISSTDENILDTASSTYQVLLQTASAPQARAQLVETLNTQYPEVESAELGIDNSTIFITCSDGTFAYIDTFDYNESNEQSSETGYAAPSGYSNDDSLDAYAIQFDGRSSVYSSQDPSPQISFDAAQSKTTAKSKKVLILGPCYYQFPDTAYDWKDVINDFQDHGWSKDDITVKIVDVDALGYIRYGNIKPEDYYNLNQYGIILFDGHGFALKNHNEDNIYLQFCFYSNSEWNNNPALKQQLREWNREKKLVFSEGKTGLDGTKWKWLPTMIRADLLRELIVGMLPSSYVYLATCHGAYFNKLFRDKGAAVVVGYTNPVSAEMSDSNMAVMNTELLDNGKSVYQAYLNDSVIKKNTFKGKEVLLKIYPDPSIFPTANEYYFPAWFDPINVTDIPQETNALTVTLISGSGATLSTKQYLVNGPTLTIDDARDILFLASGNPTVEVTAVDVSGKELASGRETRVVDAGANEVDIALSGTQDRPHVEYTYHGDYNITIDLSLSSSTWVDGGQVTATATCSCIPVGDASPYNVVGFTFLLKGGQGWIVAYSPPFPGPDYGLIENGSKTMVNWGSPNGYGSTATFTATFRLDQKVNEHPYIEARFSLWDTSANFAKIYLR